MNDSELHERQQQIRKLHKKIREYRLTPQEQQILDRNKYELECMIESKFSHSKMNSCYRFPGSQSSQRLGIREQVDLHEQNLQQRREKINTQTYETAGLSISYGQFSTSKLRQSHSPQFRHFQQSLSIEKRLTEGKQKKNQNTTCRMLTEIDAMNISQMELEEPEPCALKVPLSKCTTKKKTQQDEEPLKKILKRPPEMRLSAKQGELRVRLKGKENEKKQFQSININQQKKGIASQLKKIILGKTPENKKEAHKQRIGLLLVDRTIKAIQPMTCKNRKYDSMRHEEEIHYLRPADKTLSEQRLTKRSKQKHIHSTSKSPNKPDSKMFQSIKVKNSTAASTNQSSLTPMHSSIKEIMGVCRSTTRMPINIVSPLSRGYLNERHIDPNTQSLRVIRK